MGKRGLIAALAVLTLASVARAEPQRFELIADRLYFNSSVPSAKGSFYIITEADADTLLSYLSQNPDIRTVVLNSLGGSTVTGRSMAEIITRFGADTEVQGRCLSACTLVFMGGKHRRLAKGGVLGFHRSFVEVIGLDNSDDPHFLVAGEYDRGVDETLANTKYLLARGVDIRFALKALIYEPNDMWLPTRAELTAAGVLTTP